MENKLFIGMVGALIICLVLIGVVWGHVDYNYELKKCSNLKNSNYEFTHDVQLNAKYAQDCYAIKNHPLIYMGYLFGYGLVGAVAGFIISMLAFLIKLMAEDF